MATIEDLRDAARTRLDAARLVYETEEQEVLKLTQALDRLEELERNPTTKTQLITLVQALSGEPTFKGAHKLPEPDSN